MSKRLALDGSATAAAAAAASSATGEAARPLPLLPLEAAVDRLRAAYARTPQQRILAFYSSVLGGVTTEPAAMTIPVDDHQAHRGHAVFDTANVRGGRLIGLSYHVDRLLASAKAARIEPPFLDGDKHGIMRVVMQTVAASGARDNAYVRMWMSAGRGDFAVTPTRCKGAEFYVVVHEYDEAARTRERSEGVAEVIVGVPLKSQYLATLKSTNYLINALAGMEAKERGGHLGLQLDGNGHIAETSVGSVGFVGRDGVLRTPKLDFVLRSTTVARVKELFERNPAQVPTVKAIVYADITRDEARAAVEVIAFGGGHVTPIVKFDGLAVGGGKPGPVVAALHALLEADYDDLEGGGVHEVPYDLYSSSHSN